MISFFSDTKGKWDGCGSRAMRRLHKDTVKVSEAGKQHSPSWRTQGVQHASAIVGECAARY